MQVPVDAQVQLLIQFCEASSEQAVKVKCIGTLECLAQHPQSIDANRVSPPSHRRNVAADSLLL